MRACILVDVDDGKGLDVLKRIRDLPAHETLNVGFPDEDRGTVFLNGQFEERAEVDALADAVGDQPDVLGTTVYREKESGV